MAAAITVLQEVIDQDLSGHARGKGAYLMQRLNELARDNGMIKMFAAVAAPGNRIFSSFPKRQGGPG